MYILFIRIFVHDVDTAITSNSQQLYANCIILYNVRACDVHLYSLILTTTLPRQMSKSPCSLNFCILQHHSHRSTAASHCRDAYCLAGGDSVIGWETSTWQGRLCNTGTESPGGDSVMGQTL